jgi:hypothetical protein
LTFFDGKGRNLSNDQLAAIFARAENRGISSNQLNKKALTSLNDEIRLAQSGGEKDYNKAVDTAISKIYKVPTKPFVKPTKPQIVKAVKIDNAQFDREERRKIESGEGVRAIDMIRKISVTMNIDHGEARKILEAKKVIPAGIPDDAILQPKKKLDKKLLDEDREIILKKQRERDKARIARGETDQEKAERKQREEALRERIPTKERKLSKEVIAKLPPNLSASEVALFGTTTKKRAESKLGDIAIRRMLDKQEEKQSKFEQNQKKIIELGNLRDERADLLQKQLDATGAPVQEEPVSLSIAGGVDPLKSSREQTIEDKIRRRALDLEIEQGFSPQASMDRAKREIVSETLG